MLSLLNIAYHIAFIYLYYKFYLRERRMKDSRVMTSGDVADMLGCSAYTIRDLARKKKIPHFKVGSKYMFREDSINDWICKQEDSNRV